jgi:hypothetical protein
MTSIANGRTSSAGFLADLNGAVRENPVAAGLMGAGVLWMLLGSERIASLASGLPDVGHLMTDRASKVMEGAGATAVKTAGAAGDAARNAGEFVNASAEQAGETVTSATQEAVQAVASLGQRTGKSVQKNFTTTLEEQPLLLGALGLGIGVAVASMFSTTSMERDFVGSASRKAQDKFQDLASQAAQQAEKALGDANREAKEQGFTPAAAAGMLESAADKFKRAATAVGESISTVSP